VEANNKFMGSVQLSKHGKVVYERAVGYLDADAGKKTTTASKFRIGSITKTFTASLIFKAIEEKKLSLDDKLEKFFPTVPNASKITIANLLGHTSGIHNFTNDASYRTWDTTPKTQAEMLDIIVKAGSDFEPGTSADYSNSAFVLLGYILEKTYKKPYKDILAEKITKPLGLKNTYYGGRIDNANNEVNSYSFEGRWVKHSETDMSIPGGAGAIVSNPSDLTKFFEALFAGKVLSRASLEKMKTINNGFGMGLFTFPFDGQTSYGHTGGIDGFVSMAGYFPESKVTVAMVSNGVNMNSNDVGLAMLNWVNNQPFEVPDFTSHTYTDAELDAYTGLYESKDIPLPITITREGGKLMAQAQGQQVIPLDAGKKDVFTFNMAGIVMEFKPAEKIMVLRQGGGTFTFSRK